MVVLSLGPDGLRLAFGFCGRTFRCLFRGHHLANVPADPLASAHTVLRGKPLHFGDNLRFVVVAHGVQGTPVELPHA